MVKINPFKKYGFDHFFKINSSQDGNQNFRISNLKVGEHLGNTVEAPINGHTDKPPCITNLSMKLRKSDSNKQAALNIY